MAVLTDSQTQAIMELFHRGMAFFGDNPPQGEGIPQQWNSLMIGPTGCGKTSVAETLADMLNAACVKCTHGSWIPAGAHEGFTSTLRMVTNALGRCDRVVVFVDELDKFFADQTLTNWHSSVLNDLWLLLDKSPVLKREHLADVRSVSSIEELSELFRKRVFIIASGTWQHVYSRKQPVGFNSGVSSLKTSAAEVIKAGCLPDEVRRRFHSRIIEIHYPTPAEIGRIIQADKWLAGRLQHLGEAPDHDALHREVQEVGMTALTSFKTEHVLRARAQKSPARGV